MTSDAALFSIHARSGQEPKISPPPRVTVDGQSTFWKLCLVCGDQMPHIRREDYTECVACGQKTYATTKPEAA